MKSLDNVIAAILAHLRSWPAFYADPGSTSGDSPPGDSASEGRTLGDPASEGRTLGDPAPPILPASAAPVPGGRAWDGRPLNHRILGFRTPDVATPKGRTPEGRTAIGRCCYRVAPTEWGLPATAGRPAAEAQRPADDQRVPEAPVRRRSSSLSGVSSLPQPRGLLTCSPQHPERLRRAGGGISLV